jgi:hypothetical protein
MPHCREFSFKPEDSERHCIDIQIGPHSEVQIWAEKHCICFQHKMPPGLEDFLVQKYMSLFG